MLKLYKKYLAKFTILSLFFSAIIMLFAVQFKVSSLNKELNLIENEIISYEEEIKVLDIEWVYLTRPERLRILAQKYLKNSDYLKASQIKEKGVLEPYYLAKYRMSQEKEFAQNN